MPASTWAVAIVPRGGIALDVQRRGLMRILAVAQNALALVGQVQARRERFAGLALRCARRASWRRGRRRWRYARRPWPRGAGAARAACRHGRAHRAPRHSRSDRHSTMTCSWFLAAARSMAGPPISMFSIASSRLQSGRAVTASNGYRLTTSRSIAAMPCSAMTASSVPRRPSRPPWTSGCRVLTRPSMISGKPVSALTSVTGRCASRRLCAVPPVEIEADAKRIEPAGQVAEAGLVGHAEQRAAGRGKRSVEHRSAGSGRAGAAV